MLSKPSTTGSLEPVQVARQRTSVYVRTICELMCGVHFHLALKRAGDLGHKITTVALNFTDFFCRQNPTSWLFWMKV